MQIFLMWQAEGAPRAGVVSSRLQALFAPLFNQTPAARIMEQEAATLVCLELPVEGWRPDFYQEDAADRSWALALDWPVEARTVLAERGEAVPEDRVLPALARQLERDPAPLLERLSPPWGLVWSRAADPAIHLRNDGLGFAQLFEYQHSGDWAWASRMLAFRALGWPLKPVASEWAVRAALGWFPLEQTGYANVCVLPPGTGLRITARRIERQRTDVLRKWLAPAGGTPEDCLERGREAVRDHLRTAAPLWSRARAGLTGGWDSRAVVATLLAEDAPGVYYRVRGLADTSDVRVARELATEAGLTLEIEPGRALPPPRAAGLRETLTQALRWQAGHIESAIHKTFLSPGGRLDGGLVNIMGQHGEIGRAYYATQALAARPGGDGHLTGEEWRAGMMTYLTRQMRPPLRPAWHEAILAAIAQAASRAADYGLEGPDALDFFYLYERTRRWASGGQYAQPGKVIAPFLTPGFIQAVYSLPATARRAGNPFHRHILACNRPAWGAIGFARELEQREKARREARQRAPWWRRRLEKASLALRQLIQPAAAYQTAGRLAYDNRRYWQTAGAPLLREAFKAGGFWTEIFDPDQAHANPRDAADDLALLYLLEEIVD